MIRISNHFFIKKKDSWKLLTGHMEVIKKLPQFEFWLSWAEDGECFSLLTSMAWSLEHSVQTEMVEETVFLLLLLLFFTVVSEGTRYLFLVPGTTHHAAPQLSLCHHC